MPSSSFHFLCPDKKTSLSEHVTFEDTMLCSGISLSCFHGACFHGACFCSTIFHGNSFRNTIFHSTIFHSACFYGAVTYGTSNSTDIKFVLSEHVQGHQFPNIMSKIIEALLDMLWSTF